MYITLSNYLYKAYYYNNINSMCVTLCYYVRMLMKRMFELPDYYIERVYLDYCADVMVEMDEIECLPDSWKSQSYYWNSDSDTPYHWDITRDIKKQNLNPLREILADVPDNVHDLVYTIKYSYGNRSYKFISRSTEEFSWPPKSKEFKFTMPFISVWCLDEFDNEVKEITKHFKKAAGPRGDFHNQDVKIMDVMKYDYQKIRVKYITSSKTLNDDDSVLSLTN